MSYERRTGLRMSCQLHSVSLTSIYSPSINIHFTYSSYSISFFIRIRYSGHGGIGEGYSKIIAIDAGNCSNGYQVVNFVCQHELETKRLMRNILVSRVFSIYQLTRPIIYELPRIIEQLSSDRKSNVIVIYSLLHLFVSDPHIEADTKHS